MSGVRRIGILDHWHLVGGIIASKIRKAQLATGPYLVATPSDVHDASQIRRFVRTNQQPTTLFIWPGRGGVTVKTARHCRMCKMIPALSCPRMLEAKSPDTKDLKWANLITSRLLRLTPGVGYRIPVSKTQYASILKVSTVLAGAHCWTIWMSVRTPNQSG